jgi:hypothetical protein
MDRLVIVLIDFFSSIISMLSIVLAALSFLLWSAVRFFKSIPYLYSLLSNGLLNLYLLVKLNEIAGRQAEAESLLINLHRKVEGLYKDGNVESLRDVYIHFSNVAVRQYFNHGKIEDACLLVIRVANFLDLEFIPGYENFDVSLAHVIKAGVSAAKLLSEGGLATMMLNPNELPSVEGASDSEGVLKNLKVRKEGDCKIIDFPILDPSR